MGRSLPLQPSSARGWRRLGGWLNELRRSGQLDRTRVVFTSDHGEEFLEHDSWEHGYSLCDHQIRVPLWIREPGARSAGRRLSDVVSLVDVMPTLQGVDHSDRIYEHAEAPARTAALSTGIMNRPNVHSLRTDRYRLLWDASSDEIQLFDTYEDPEESDDVAASQPELAAELRHVLQSRLEGIASSGTLETKVVPIPDELRERLRALGYVQ